MCALRKKHSLFQDWIIPLLKFRSCMFSCVMVSWRWPSLVVAADGSYHSKSLRRQRVRRYDG
jgi:hypothetical protein